MPHVTADEPLEQFANALGSDSYAIILNRSPAPTLRVGNRQTPALTEDIHAQGGWFRGTATGLIAPCGDIPAAVQAVARAVNGQVR